MGDEHAKERSCDSRTERLVVCNASDAEAASRGTSAGSDHSVCGSDAPPLVCDPEHRTLNRHAPCGSASDWTRHNPWRAPGSAPVYDACGKAGGQDAFAPYAGATYYITTANAKVGDLGSEVLPPRPVAIRRSSPGGGRGHQD